jgi:hypothetical protein
LNGRVRRRTLLVGAALLVATASHASARPPAAEGVAVVGDVAVFYYPWYGNPSYDGVYRHWGQNENAPPASIASGYYPARGIYSSSDRSLLRGHMEDLTSAGATTIVVSWWGAGSIEDGRFATVVEEARAHGLRVALHVEPYAGRTPAGVVDELARLRPLGISDVYVYDSANASDAEWREANARVDGIRVFAHTSLPGKAAAGGFDGLYTYDVLTYDGSSFGRLCNGARRLGLLCAPSVGPGFDARRATGDPRVRPRNAGATYDRMWRSAIRAAADVVTVTSYNEWHEGTQIEPARAAGRPYACYDGAWGLRGPAAERAYLDRTALWAERYGERLAQYRAAASLRR